MLAEIKVSRNEKIRNFGYYLGRNSDWNLFCFKTSNTDLESIYCSLLSLLFTKLPYSSKLVAWKTGRGVRVERHEPMANCQVKLFGIFSLKNIRTVLVT